MSARASRRTAVLLGLAGGASLAASTRATWIAARGQDVTGALRDVDVSGAQAAPAAVALAVVAIAAALVLGLSGPRLRLILGPLLIVIGGGAIAAAVGAALAPAAAAAAAVAESTAVAGGDIRATTTAWPWVAAAAALLVALDGALVLTAGRAWSAGTGASRASERSADLGEDPAGAWDALSRGEDPTAGSDEP